MSKFLEQSKPKNLREWSAKMIGARQMLMALLDRDYVNMGKNMGRYGRGNSKAHHEALRQWLLQGLDNIDIFLTEPYRITYGDFETDKKGKLVKCKVKLKPWQDVVSFVDERINR